MGDGHIWPRRFLGGYVGEDSGWLGEWILTVCQLMNAWAINSRLEDFY